jgi:hypothetical protein
VHGNRSSGGDVNIPRDFECPIAKSEHIVIALSVAAHSIAR